MNLKGMEALVAPATYTEANFVSRIRHVDGALAVLGKLKGKDSLKSVRTISAGGRKRIAAAQKARWAKIKGNAKPGPAKRTKPAASRRRIAAAQRTRWRR